MSDNTNVYRDCTLANGAYDDCENLLRRQIADDVAKALRQVAHDLRSPLTSIRTSAELLRDPACRQIAPVDLLLDNIRKSSARMTAIIDQLLVDLPEKLRQNPSPQPAESAPLHDPPNELGATP